jgi:hypothetical protein
MSIVCSFPLYTWTRPVYPASLESNGTGLGTLLGMGVGSSDGRVSGGIVLSTTDGTHPPEMSVQT